MATSPSLRERLRLMVITDPGARLETLEAVEHALRAGAPTVQLRWKGASSGELLDRAGRLRKSTDAFGALLIINDRVDVALAVGADGAHLGDDDLPLEVARRITPPGFILGRSVDDAAEAEAAERGGADYVGLGPVFPTRNKSGLGKPIGADGVAAVRSRVRLPIVAVGGIDAARTAAVIHAGANGVAVIGSVMSAVDPGAATKRLLEEVGRGGDRSR